jgi:hypothetical protein
VTTPPAPGRHSEAEKGPGPEQHPTYACHGGTLGGAENQESP